MSNIVNRSHCWQYLCIGVAISFVVGCAKFVGSSTLTPLPIIPARDLLLDAQAFPKGWGVGSCAPNCSRSEGEAYAERSFYITGVPGHVLQSVFRLDDVEAAKAKFQSYREVDFNKLVPPPEITYRSFLADEYYLGCGIDAVPACRAILRYGNYFIAFYFDINSGKGDGLQIADVEPILRTIDQRVAARLDILLPTTAPNPTR